MSTEKLTLAILDLWSREDLDKEELLWRVDDKKVSFYVGCNDFFFWGTADAEAIDAESLPMLRQAVAECKAMDREEWGLRLYAARRRQMRPQGAFYKLIPSRLWALFDACGPVRETDEGNPRMRPEDPSE